MKPLNALNAFELADMAGKSVDERCHRIVAEFDEWLAVRVLWLKLTHADLPRLNDAFRDYFSDTRTARTPGDST